MSNGNTNSCPRITITSFRLASKPGSVKSYFDARIDLPDSSVEIFGASLVQHDPVKSAWVSYPQRAAKNGKKYFAIVKVTGELHAKICAAALQEWERTRASTVPHAQIPREPGDEAPF